VASVTFDGVGKTYNDGTRAVSDLSLEVNDGEFVVLVGPSGCGKTTALRMVAGLEEITDGEIRIGDRVVNWVDPQDRDIAMVFQNYALYPQMTVAENIAFGLKMRKVPRNERSKRVEEIARVLGLQEFLGRKPGKLSGGQRQRVAMGRAIVREPKAFLMDEPLSNLDAKLRVQMRAEISRIQREVETTTIYVTHDQVEAMTMGDRVAVMRHGELQQVDEPQRLFDSPSNLFVASFIGSPPMNLVEARIDSRNSALTASFGGQELTIPDEVVARRSSLRDYVGRQVALGIRPHNFEDAAVDFAPGGGRLRGRVQLTEALGSELVAHVAVPGKAVEHEAVLEGAVYEAEEQEAAKEFHVGAREGETTLVASLDPISSAREDMEIELAVDTRRLHFFDLESAAAIDGRA
jgi:multiple sugar transport system ATP-binding protein